EISKDSARVRFGGAEASSMATTLFGQASTKDGPYPAQSATPRCRFTAPALLAFATFITMAAPSGGAMMAQTPVGSVPIDIKKVADENAKKLKDCSLYPNQATSSYILPWKSDTSHRVWQTTSHFKRPDGGVGLYAIDIEMPTGTQVVAARGGEVVATQDTFYDGSGSALEENFIFIRHEDGTISRYLHLTHRGVLVRLGSQVAQGQAIGRSGNTGETNGPHLHFDVQRCGPNLPPNFNALPCGQTLPV